MDLFVDDFRGFAETLEGVVNECLGVHGDDTELVLVIDPQEESLVIVVEEASTVWPVALEPGESQSGVVILEQVATFSKVIFVRVTHLF